MIYLNLKFKDSESSIVECTMCLLMSGLCVVYICTIVQGRVLRVTKYYFVFKKLYTLYSYSKTPLIHYLHIFNGVYNKDVR